MYMQITGNSETNTTSTCKRLPILIETQHQSTQLPTLTNPCIQTKDPAHNMHEELLPAGLNLQIATLIPNKP
jgi:hypothetical protein